MIDLKNINISIIEKQHHLRSMLSSMKSSAISSINKAMPITQQRIKQIQYLQNTKRM